MSPYVSKHPHTRTRTHHLLPIYDTAHLFTMVWCWIFSAGEFVMATILLFTDGPLWLIGLGYCFAIVFAIVAELFWRWSDAEYHRDAAHEAEMARIRKGALDLIDQLQAESNNRLQQRKTN